MIQRAHPFRRGFLLALVFAIITVLAGSFSIAPCYSAAGFPGVPHLFAASVIAGAFAASLPRRIRRRQPLPPSDRRGCLTAFLGGMLLMLSLYVAGADSFHLIGGMMQGSIGALAFLLCAWPIAGITALIIRRKQA